MILSLLLSSYCSKQCSWVQMPSSMAKIWNDICWCIGTWPLPEWWESVSPESRAKFYQCADEPSKPANQVHTHVVQSKENLSRHPHHESLLIHVNRYKTNTLCLSYINVFMACFSFEKFISELFDINDSRFDVVYWTLFLCPSPVLKVLLRSCAIFLQVTQMEVGHVAVVGSDTEDSACIDMLPGKAHTALLWIRHTNVIAISISNTFDCYCAKEKQQIWHSLNLSLQDGIRI